MPTHLALRLARRLLLPLLSCAALSGLPAPAQQPGRADRTVVTTGCFEIAFSHRGGVPERWQVIEGGGDPEAPPPTVDLIDPDYAAASSWWPLSVVTDPGAAGADRRPYQVAAAEENGARVLTFTSPVAEDGLQIVKTYTIPESGHLLTLRVELHNRGSAPLELARDGAGPGIAVGPGLGYSIGRRPELFDEGRDPSVLPYYRTAGGVFGAGVPTDEPHRMPLTEDAQALDWGGVHAQYYTLAVVPDAGAASEPPFVRGVVELATSAAVFQLVDEADNAHYPRVTFFHRAVSLAPGTSSVFTYRVYAGPKDRALLRATGLGLEAIPFHHLWDWLAGLCLALQWILAALEGVLGSWGLSIVVFALLFRLVTLPLSLYGAKHQLLMKAKMAQLKPLVAELKQKHKKDGDALNEAILALYKEHGVNPFSNFKGCLPLMVQLPVLIALFQLLMHSFDLRGVGFLWIDDLTLTDRLFGLGLSIPWLGSYFNLLPVIMFVAMIVMARRMRAPGQTGSPGGAIYAAPVALTLLFYPFPAGCMLFWTTGTVVQVFEQRLSMRMVGG